MLRKLLDASDGGFEDGMSAHKYTKLTGVSKATRYYVDVPGWNHGIDDRR